KLRVGVARAPFFDGLDPDVAKAIAAAIDVVRSVTASVADVQVPSPGSITDIWNPEIYAYHLPWITKTPELYQDATRNLIQGAGRANAATYAQARRQLDVVRREIKNVFATVDVLITPTQRGVAPFITPPPAGSVAAPPAGGLGGLMNTAAFDIYGLPTISVPCGVSGAGLPLRPPISGTTFSQSE